MARFSPRLLVSETRHWLQPLLQHPEPFATRLRLLGALRDTSHDRYWDLAREMLQAMESLDGICVAERRLRAWEHQTEWHELVDIARNRHGSRVDVFLQSFEERTREQNITARRQEIWDADHRFFLALLLNLPHRRAITQLIAAKHPGKDPEALILQWVGDLSAAKKIGLEFDALSLKMLQHVLRDLTLDDMMRGLAEVFGEAHVAEERINLHRLWREVHDATLLRPLLQSGTAECVINPVARVDARSRDGRLEFSIEAPVRGERPSGCTTVSADSHPEAFRLLTLATKQAENRTLILASHETDALRTLGLLVPAENVSRPVELDITVSADQVQADLLSGDPMSDVVFNPGPDRLPTVPLRTLPDGEIVMVPGCRPAKHGFPTVCPANNSRPCEPSGTMAARLTVPLMRSVCGGAACSTKLVGNSTVTAMRSFPRCCRRI